MTLFLYHKSSIIRPHGLAQCQTCRPCFIYLSSMATQWRQGSREKPRSWGPGGRHSQIVQRASQFHFWRLWTVPPSVSGIVSVYMRQSATSLPVVSLKLTSLIDLFGSLLGVRRQHCGAGSIPDNPPAEGADHDSPSRTSPTKPARREGSGY